MAQLMAASFDHLTVISTNGQVFVECDDDPHGSKYSANKGHCLDTNADDMMEVNDVRIDLL